MSPETKKMLADARELMNSMIGINADRFAPDVIVMTDDAYSHLINHIDSMSPVSIDGNHSEGCHLKLDGIQVKHFPTAEICRTQATWMKINGNKVLLIE